MSVTFDGGVVDWSLLVLAIVMIGIVLYRAYPRLRVRLRQVTEPSRSGPSLIVEAALYALGSYAVTMLVLGLFA